MSVWYSGSPSTVMRMAGEAMMRVYRVEIPEVGRRENLIG